MRKKARVWLTMFLLCLCLFLPQMQVKAATGKTTIAVSSGSLNIGETVTVTAKAFGAGGETAYASMVLNYDASILEFVSCTATYGGGGGSISVANDSFSVTLKAISAGKASVSLSASDGVIFATAEELDSMAGSSTSITVNNAAADNNAGNSTNNATNSDNNAGAANGTTSGTNQEENNGGENSSSKPLSADNSLKKLTISPGTLSPAFQGSKTKYTASVDNSVTNIAVSAIPVNEKATVESVTGNTNLAVGTNVISIVVKAENGTTATYKITVTREDANNDAAADTPPQSAQKPQETEKTDDNEKEPDSEVQKPTQTPESEVKDSETTKPQDSEEKDSETAASEETDSETTEETTERVPDAEIVVPPEAITVNNVLYYISEEFTAEQIPADFTETVVNFRGKEYRGLTFNKGILSLVYLREENTNAADGRFFLYDETRDVVYDFIKMTAGESSYVIPLLAPLDSLLSDDYVQASLQLPQGAILSAYQLPQEDGASDFFVFYGVNQHGTEGWYQYDFSEGTYQRVNGTVAEGTNTDREQLELLQAEYDALSEKYKSAKASVRNLTIALIGVIFAAAVVFFAVFFKKKKKLPRGYSEDDFLEDRFESQETKKEQTRENAGMWNDYEDNSEKNLTDETFAEHESEQEEPFDQEETQTEESELKNKKKQKKKTKKNEASDKNEVEIFDLNDL